MSQSFKKDNTYSAQGDKLERLLIVEAKCPESSDLLQGLNGAISWPSFFSDLRPGSPVLGNWLDEIIGSPASTWAT